MSSDSQHDAARHLAANLKSLRSLGHLTQSQLSKASGVPRATIATLESGSANPTLQVLVRLAAALRVTLEELVAPPRAVGRIVRSSDLPTTLRGGVSVRELLPEPVPGLVLERMHLSVGARMSGTPHAAGTREYFACEQGQVEVWCSGEQHLLDAGDVLIFRGDQRHSYANAGQSEAVGYSVVVVQGI